MHTGNIIQELITIYFLYIVAIVIVITATAYLTYRFLKFLLPTEENNIFIANAPVIWQNSHKGDSKEMMIEAIEEYMEKNK